MKSVHVPVPHGFRKVSLRVQCGPVQMPYGLWNNLWPVLQTNMGQYRACSTHRYGCRLDPARLSTGPKLSEAPFWKLYMPFFQPRHSFLSALLRFKYTTKFSLPKIACPAIIYAEIIVVIDLFFVSVCPWIKVYHYNPTEICQQRLQDVRNMAQKLCSWEHSFIFWTNGWIQTGTHFKRSD